MLKVTDLNSFSANAVSAIAGLHTHFTIVTESHLRKKLRDLNVQQSPFLLAVLPSSHSEAPNKDAQSWQNELMFFILKGPIDYSNRTAQGEIDDYQETQDLAIALANYLDEQSGDCNWLNEYDGDKIEIDPEYNFQSCDGWSVTMNIKTNL